MCSDDEGAKNVLEPSLKAAGGECLIVKDISVDYFFNTVLWYILIVF